MDRGRNPNNLREHRHCLALSLKKVARMLGLADNSTLSRWETGVVYPSIVQVFRLARIYRVLPHELYQDLWQKLEEEGRLLTQGEESF